MVIRESIYTADMKIFWSWQFDTPGRIGRHFVRDSLGSAIAELQQEADIEDAFRDAHLDQDRKGIPGSPSLAETILFKIEASTVFVADVTPVGNVANSQKKLINSNVAIELGYALKCVTDRGLLMVMNEAYGKREELPFDLRHKAGPLTFELNENATTQEIKQAKKKFVSELKIAISEIVKAVPKSFAAPFPEAHANTNNPGLFFDQTKFLVSTSFESMYFFPHRSITYVRVIPSGSPLSLGRVEAENLAGGDDYLQLFNYSRIGGSNPRQNHYGAINFNRASESEIISTSQLFKTGELWGIDGYVLHSDQVPPCVPTGLHERMIAQGLAHFLTFSNKKLGFEPPFTVEIGMTNVEGYVLAMPSNYWEKYSGPITEQHVIKRRELTSLDPVEIDKLLLNYFALVFDAAGRERPANYNGFPGEKPGILPRS